MCVGSRALSGSHGKQRGTFGPKMRAHSTQWRQDMVPCGRPIAAAQDLRDFWSFIVPQRWRPIFAPVGCIRSNSANFGRIRVGPKPVFVFGRGRPTQLWPNLGQLRPRNRPNLARHRRGLCRLQPDLGRSSQLGPTLTNAGPISTDSIDRFWAEFGRIWTDQRTLRMVLRLPDPGRCRSNVGRSRPKLAPCRPSLGHPGRRNSDSQ